MRHRTVYFDLTDTADERFDRVIEGMLVGLLLFSPLALGVVQAWSEWVVILLAAGMALVLGAKLLRRPDVRFVWSWTYLPIGVVLLLGVIQLIPLPVTLVESISPHTYRIKSSLLALVDATPFHMTLSFYPEGTLQNLRILVAISTVYVVALNVIRSSGQVRRILMAIAMIGALVAIIGILHLVFRATRVYGVVGESYSNWITGPFIARNHFGQFMNLGLGAGVALLLMSAEEIQEKLRRGWGGSGTSPAIWMSGGAVALMGVAVFLSLSRGAILSVAIAGGIAAGVVMRRGMSARLWLLMPVGWAVGLVVIYFGFDLLAGRFEHVIDPQKGAVGGRMTIVRDILSAARQAPVLGYGLGTFETVYPMFDSSTSATLAIHAENEYAQALFEGGAIELAMVLLFLVMVGGSYLVCIQSAPSPSAMPAVGLGMGVLAVAIQSLSDFGQHLPANAMVTAVQCAMLMNLATATRLTEVQSPASARARPGTRAIGIIAAAIVLAVVVYDGLNAARAEWRWFEVRAIHPFLRDRQWQGDDQDYARLLTAAADASRIRPGDVNYRYWLGFYRFRAISRDRDSLTGQVIYDARQLGWARQIASELREAVPICPTYGPNFSLAGQIERNVLEQLQADSLIRQGFELSRTDPAAAFESAMLDARAGRWDEALVKFEHAAQLIQGYRLEGAIALATTLQRPDLAIRLTGNDPGITRQVLGILDRTGRAEAAQIVREHLLNVIRTGALASDAPAGILLEAADLAMTEKNPAAAIGYLQRALLIDPTKPTWRLQLARALVAQGNLARALEEAQLAQRLRAPGAEELVIDLRTRPTTGTTSPANGR